MVWQFDDDILNAVNEDALTLSGVSRMAAVDMIGFLRMVKNAIQMGLVCRHNRALPFLDVPRTTHNSVRCCEIVVN